MNFTLVPFTHDHLESARDIFLENYADERQHNPLLPSRVVDEPVWFREMLQPHMEKPGVAVIHQNQVLAYMVTGFHFSF